MRLDGHAHKITFNIINNKSRMTSPALLFSIGIGVGSFTFIDALIIIPTANELMQPV